MQRLLPNACFIAMTGTPLFKRTKAPQKNLEE
ncbi:MAG: hypothetical protein IPH46_14975 [Bacteroidetes bacterium]|nr:hypothetical protein [Bacteroidota bacterium]